MSQSDPTLPYRAQHKLRLSYMPWLYWTLKPQQKQWAQQWQKEWQDYLQAMETVEIRGDCFIAPEARLFAEPGRAIVIEQGSFIAADSVLHGPIHIGPHVAVNHHCTLDGGRAGITLKAHARLAAYCKLYAFNHGMAPERTIAEQPVTSKGITVGQDVWLGTGVCIVDGVAIGDGAIAGAGSVITRDVERGTKIAGNPARKIGSR